MPTPGGDVAFRFLGDTSGLTTAVKEVAQAQEAAAAIAAKTANEAKVALEAERLATVKVTDAEKELAKQLTATDAAAKSKAAALGVSVGQLKQVEAATQKAAAATLEAADATDAGATKFDKLGKAMGPLGGVLARISPEAGAAASTVAGLTSAFEGAAAAGIAMETAVPVLIALTAAVGAGYAIWRLYNDQAERAAARAKQNAEDAATEAAYVKALDEAQYHLKQTVGTLTEAEEKRHAKAEIMAKLTEDVIGKTDQQASVLRGLASKTVYANEQEIEYAYALKETASALTGKASASKAASGADKEAAAAAKEAAKTTSEFQKGAQAATDAAASRGSALVTKIKADQKKADEELTKAEVENAAFRAEAEKRYGAALEAVAKQQEKVANTAMSTAASVASSIADAIHMTADAAASAYSKAKSAASKIAGQIKDLGLDAKDAAKLTGDALVKAYTRGEVAASDLSDVQKEAIATELSAREAAANKRAKIERKAAMDWFEAQQAVAVASALVAGAVAIVQSFAQLGPTAGAIAAVGIGVTTGVQVAAIEAQKPSFHSGGMYPDEGSARVLGGEPILNRQAAARVGLDSPGAVDNVNHGGGSLGGVTVVKIGRLEAREIVRTDVAAGGLIVQTAQRAARSSGNAAGRTGRRPVA